jgi:MFS family permease
MVLDHLLVIFVQTVISQFFDPAKSAILPHIVGKDHLMVANSLDSMGNEFARLVGPPLGGALLGVLGLTSVVLLDSLSFLISGLMLMFIVVHSLPSINGEKQKRNTPHSITSILRAGIREGVKFWQEWLAGLRLVRKENLLTTLFIIEGITMVAEGIIDVLWVVFVQEILQGSSLEFGWLSGVFALGSLFGGFIIGQMDNASPTRLIVFGSTAIGVIWLAMINIPILPLALIFLFLNGIVAIGYWVSMRTLLQINVADQYRGRVFGAYNTTNSLMRLSGMGLTIVLGDQLGASFMLSVAASIFVMVGGVALIRLRNLLSTQLMQQ